MRSNFRALVVAAALGASLAALGGCTQMQSAWGGVQTLFGAPSPQVSTTVAAAENAYTTVSKLATAYLKTGKATAGQKAEIARADSLVYADIVAARNAVAKNDSPAVAVALQTFNVDLPKLSALIPTGQ